MKKNGVKVYYNDFLLKKGLSAVFLGQGLLGFCGIGWGVQWLLLQILGHGAEPVLKGILCLFILLVLGWFGYMLLNLSRMGLVLGIDDRGRLYWLPSREQILKDPRYAEEPDIEKMFDVQKRLPELPEGAREIVGTAEIRERDGVYYLQCLVWKDWDMPAEKMKFSVSPHYFQNFQELMEAFRALQ